MSTFVLKRNYGLELPASYVEVDSEEMEYVDGGGPHYGFSGYITYRVSRTVINAAVGIGASAAVSLALGSAGITGGLTLLAVPALSGLIAAVASNGLLKQDWYYFDVLSMGLDYALLSKISGYDNQITLHM
ncbi:hypothetical protein J1C67_05400 [Clostridium gasigenes]|uniref:hypothetical protein n=1 Tax=Clostridium gasigenes TaxID=94869 RepID=UPI00143862F6|nr:hypothetical protein [Clostridium gasigenes]NKF08026.1 hypothetical protein [Clostridium gasigenes]QSW20598.1 hypothetical protein J1C67_05400 [Clostridium gasigenes]